MLIEIIFERDPANVLQQLNTLNINLEGQYLDIENDIYRIVVKDIDVRSVKNVLDMMGQWYRMSIPKVYKFISGVPGQVAEVWKIPEVVTTYLLEDDRIVAITNNVYNE